MQKGDPFSFLSICFSAAKYLLLRAKIGKRELDNNDYKTIIKFLVSAIRLCPHELQWADRKRKRR